MADEIDHRGKAVTVFMAHWAIAFLEEITNEQTRIPKKGKGRILEELLLKEKSRREKKKAAESPEQKTA